MFVTRLVCGVVITILMFQQRNILKVNVADATCDKFEVPTATATIAQAIPVPWATNTTETYYVPETALGLLGSGSGDEIERARRDDKYID